DGGGHCGGLTAITPSPPPSQTFADPTSGGDGAGGACADRPRFSGPTAPRPAALLRRRARGARGHRGLARSLPPSPEAARRGRRRPSHRRSRPPRTTVPAARSCENLGAAGSLMLSVVEGPPPRRPELFERAGRAVEHERRRLTHLDIGAERPPSMPIQAARDLALGAGDGLAVPVVIPAARAHCRPDG